MRSLVLIHLIADSYLIPVWIGRSRTIVCKVPCWELPHNLDLPIISQVLWYEHISLMSLQIRKDLPKWYYSTIHTLCPLVCTRSFFIDDVLDTDYLFICGCVCLCVHHECFGGQKCRFSSSSGNGTQEVRLGSKHLKHLSHLSNHKVKYIEDISSIIVFTFWGKEINWHVDRHRVSN